MRFEKAQIVRSLRGHDSGTLYCVIGIEGDRLLLADGRRRRVGCPKRKSCGHVAAVDSVEHPILAKVRSGQAVGDRELRCALAQIRDRTEV